MGNMVYKEVENTFAVARNVYGVRVIDRFDLDNLFFTRLSQKLAQKIGHDIIQPISKSKLDVKRDA